MTETITPVTLKHAAARFHAAKTRAAALETWWNERIEALREIHANTLHELDEARIDAREAEDLLRAAALAEFEATGKKTLGHGVGIRVQKRLSYDKDQALLWAYANRQALALDVKAFEKLAKERNTIGHANEKHLDFVEIVEEAVITLPLDAAKLLGEG